MTNKRTYLLKGDLAQSVRNFLRVTEESSRVYVIKKHDDLMCDYREHKVALAEREKELGLTEALKKQYMQEWEDYR